MSLGIAGIGWVTPLGNDVDTVWQRLQNREQATAQSIESPLGPSCPVFKVPADFNAQVPIHPRLRRSSAISRFAAVAGLAALKNAELALTPETAARTALVFAVSNGGVIYTKKFYDEIVDSGTQAASPLLFPETVFNAPASHLAAILGITGASYTLVGDGAVGVLALKMAEDLMGNESLDQCLVVGAEEADWLLCDAYRRWRLLRNSPTVEPFQKPPRGTTLSEGAGAVLINRDGKIQIEKIEAGTNFRNRAEAARCVEEVMTRLCQEKTDLLVASANGTFVDAAEQAAALRSCPNAKIFAIKRALGESVGASSLWQTICGVQLLVTQVAPPGLIFDLKNEMSGTESSNDEPCRSAVVSVCGLNQQVAGLRLVKP